MRRPNLNRSFARYRDRGDPDALAWVFDQTAPALRRIAGHVAKGRMEADDLVQATFLTVSGQVLVRLAQNASQRADVTRETELPDAPVPKDAHESDILDAVLAREERDSIQRAVDSLPKKYREVVRRHLDETLKFRFEQVPPGPVTLRLWGPEEEFVVDVKPYETTTCELIARPPK